MALRLDGFASLHAGDPDRNPLWIGQLPVRGS
jgi:hypothetical protein